MKRKNASFFAMVLLIASTGLALWGSPGICAPRPPSDWDEDGGFTYDYSQVTRLKWMGSIQPDTYEEYMLRRGNPPFSIRHAFSSTIGTTGTPPQKALVLVNDNLYSGIETKLLEYVTDLENEGYTLEVYTTSGGTPPDLKEFIMDNSADLVGCVFFGDMPVAWYELEVWEHEEFPCDLYYMDLDGVWIDSDSDGKWDGHTGGTGDEGPEIFIGHIDTSMMSGDEVLIANTYLEKIHSYRTGGIYVPGFGLTYTEDDWAPFMDIRTDIRYSYPCFQDIPAPATSRNDYLSNRIPNPAYEFIQLACHSGPTGHAFTRGGWASNADIKAAVPHAMFFNLFACSSLRYTVEDFLGGSYIYNSSVTSLAVIGSTKTGSMLVFYAFYQPFGFGRSFGGSFRDWFNYIAPYNNDEKAWHFGMTVAGDPFLKRTGYPPVLSDISPDSGSIQGGFNVTITGSNFNYGVTSVLFGSNSATGITIEDGNLLTCLTPRGDSVGFVDVTITSLFGSDVLLNGYEYLPSPPLIYSVNPSRGYVGSETPVTINGDFFTTTADTQVLFGSQNASGVEVVDTSTITCLTPIATEHGYVDVTVINSNGSGTLENGFRYSLHPPKIYAVDPDTGPGCGGNLVTVIGDYFTDFTTVFFSWLVASDITCIDPNTLTCRPPAGKGTVDVIVAHDLGEFDTLPSAYTYISVEVFAVEPDYGHVLGGDIITITGTNFTTSEDTNVKFGALNAPWVNVINSTKMEVQTPPRNPGKVNVTVINSYGIALLENGFEYLNRPLLYFLGGDVMAGSPVAFKIRAPNRPYENLCLLANNQLGPTHFPGMGITLDLALEGILVKYNSFGGGSALDLNGQGERTCLVNIPDYPPGLIYWQAIVGKLSPISLEVSNRVDLEILE